MPTCFARDILIDLVAKVGVHFFMAHNINCVVDIVGVFFGGGADDNILSGVSATC